MAHPRTLHDPSYWVSVRQGDEDGYITQQGKHEDVPTEVFAPYMHPTSHCQYIPNSLALGDGRLLIRNLPRVNSNTVNFSQVSEPFPPSWNPLFISNDLLEHQMNFPNRSSFLNQSGISSPAVEAEDFNPMTLNGNGLSMIGFNQPMSATDVSGQTNPFVNAQVDVDTFPEFGSIGNCNEEELISVNESPPFINHVSWIEPLHNIDENALHIGNMLKDVEYDQQMNESTDISFAAALSQEYSLASPYTGTASCGIQKNFHGGATWDLERQIHATMLPVPPPVNIQSINTTSLPYILAAIDRRSFLQDNAQSGLIHPFSANVALQQYTFINSSCKDVTARRSKKLDRTRSWGIERRMLTAQMRKRHSCGHCYVNKVKCSKGEVCDHCQRVPKSPFLGTSCHRGRLVDYLDLILPQFLVKHLSQDDIKEFTSPLQFTEEQHLIQVSTGRAHPLITLLACRIVAPNKEFLAVPALAFAANDHAQAFTTVKTLEYALRDYNLEQIKQKWRHHIEAISTSNNISGDRRTLRCKLLLMICRFLETVAPVSKENNILRNAIMMNRIQHIMSRLIVIKEDPELKGTSNASSPSARVLNRQLKGILIDLQKDITKEVLRDLDRLLRRQTTGTWDICLCSFLVLCMCIEDLQVTIDLFIFSQLSSENERGSPVEQNGVNVCTKLETETLENSWILLHAILKRILNNRHPFRRGGKLDDRPGRHVAQLKFWGEMSQLIVDHSTEISARSSDHYQGGCSRVLEDHLLFRRRNEGRLTSIALQELVVLT